MMLKAEKCFSRSRLLDSVGIILQGVTGVTLLAVAAGGFLTTSTDEAISRLTPWWIGYATVCLLLALVWLAHAGLARYIPVAFSLTLATISSMVMVFGAALFQPAGWGAVFWIPCGLFIAIAITALMGPATPRQRSR